MGEVGGVAVAFAVGACGPFVFIDPTTMMQSMSVPLLVQHIISTSSALIRITREGIPCTCMVRTFHRRSRYILVLCTSTDKTSAVQRYYIM